MNERPSQDRITALLDDALKGDISQIDELRRASQQQLLAAAQVLGSPLTFGRPTVLRILRDWRDGNLTDDQVRCWAQLMFFRTFPDDCRPQGWQRDRSGQRLDIDYSMDETVHEVVFDLKDLGDFDDYWIVRDRDKMIAELSR